MGLIRGAARGLRAARNRLRGMDAGNGSTASYSTPSALSTILQHTGAGAALGGGGGAIHAGLTGGDMGEGAMNGAMIGGALGAAIPGVAGARAFMGGLRANPAEFLARKEALAAQVEAQSPQAAQLIRSARDAMDLDDILGRLQNPASFGQGAGVGGSTVTQQGADFGMRPPQEPWGR